MRNPAQEKLQRTLRFEPQLRINLPEAARAEAVSVLAVLIATAMRNADRVEHDGGSPRARSAPRRSPLWRRSSPSHDRRRAVTAALAPAPTSLRCRAARSSIRTPGARSPIATSSRRVTASPTDLASRLAHSMTMGGRSSRSRSNAPSTRRRSPPPSPNDSSPERKGRTNADRPDHAQLPNRQGLG